MKTNHSVRSSSVLSVVCGVIGWLPLGVSLFAALADSSNTAMAVPLATAGGFAALGLGFSLRGLLGDASTIGWASSALGLTLNAALMAASGVWALTVHWQ